MSLSIFDKIEMSHSLVDTIGVEAAADALVDATTKIDFATAVTIMEQDPSMTRENFVDFMDRYMADVKMQDELDEPK